MNYCSACGSSNLAFKVPPGDTRDRHVCGDCGTVFYENPKIVAGCILEWRGRILLCRRSIEPRSGLWTVPAGFMENRETVAEAAAREAMEEARAASNGLRLQSIYNLRHVSQVYMLYHGELRDGRAEAGAETSEIALYREDQIPWESIAFPVIREALERYFEDRARGPIRLHTGDLDRDRAGEIKITRASP